MERKVLPIRGCKVGGRSTDTGSFDGYASRWNEFDLCRRLHVRRRLNGGLRFSRWPRLSKSERAVRTLGGCGRWTPLFTAST